MHALTAFCHECGVVLAQEPIERGADKSEGELTVAPALVARVTWPGRVLTGDVLFCQRRLCVQVLAAGGDYLLLVKEHQPTLFADLGLLFDPPAALGPAALLDRRAVSPRERGHGRQEEVRHLVASTDLTAYLAWPGVAQAFLRDAALSLRRRADIHQIAREHAQVVELEAAQRSGRRHDVGTERRDGEGDRADQVEHGHRPARSRGRQVSHGRRTSAKTRVLAIRKATQPRPVGPDDPCRRQHLQQRRGGEEQGPDEVGDAIGHRADRGGEGGRHLPVGPARRPPLRPGHDRGRRVIGGHRGESCIAVLNGQTVAALRSMVRHPAAAGVILYG